MFREVRRKKNELSADAAKKLLSNERRAILAMNGDDGYPYAIPVNYLYSEADGRIYFHGSPVGYKAELIEKCPKICFTVYGSVSVGDPEWAPFVQSAVVFGRCRRVEDKERTLRLAREFARKYYPDEESIEAVIAGSGDAVRMFEIVIEHITGKQVQEK